MVTERGTIVKEDECSNSAVPRVAEYKRECSCMRRSSMMSESTLGIYPARIAEWFRGSCPPSSFYP